MVLDPTIKSDDTGIHKVSFSVEYRDALSLIAESKLGDRNKDTEIRVNQIGVLCLIKRLNFI